MPSALRDNLLFFASFLRNPVAVSSVIPTSRFGVERVCTKINGSVRRVIVEYGPGTGVVARRLLAPGTLTKDSRMILIERTKELAEALRISDIGCDPRVSVFHDSAENVEAILHTCGETEADEILSSIPLSVMPRATREKVLEATKRCLKPDGRFIVFLIRRRVLGYLRAAFPHVRTEWEPLNIPPIFIFEASQSPLPPRTATARRRALARLRERMGKRARTEREHRSGPRM